MTTGGLTVTTPSDREIVMTRTFDAPRRLVWDAWTKPELMGMGGVYREIEAPVRLVSTEKFDNPWYPGEAQGTIVLAEQGSKTIATMTIRYESREARDGVLKSPMADGVERSYQKLDAMLASGAMQGA